MSGDGKERPGKQLPIAGQVAATAAPDALERLLAGDSAAVIEALSEQVAQQPEDDGAWLRLGICYERIGHAPEAADALGRAVALDGGVPLSRRLYAYVLAQLGRHDEAVFQRLQARRLSPNDAHVQRELGVAFYDKGLFDKALRELTRALDMAPDDSRTHFALGLVQEAKGDIAAALAGYRNAVKLNSTSLEFHRTLADALASTGEMAEAMSQLEEARKLDRSNTQIAMNLDVLRRGMGELLARRLLGKSESDIDRSALVQEGQLKRRLKRPAEDGEEGTILCYAAALAELWAELDADSHIRRMALVLLDPRRASQLVDTTFKVMVLAQDGSQHPADYATAVSLTFLREALGCPMTRASTIYARLLREREGFEWGGAQLRIGEEVLGGKRRMGIFVKRPPAQPPIA